MIPEQKREVEGGYSEKAMFSEVAPIVSGKGLIPVPGETPQNCLPGKPEQGAFVIICYSP